MPNDLKPGREAPVRLRQPRGVDSLRRGKRASSARCPARAAFALVELLVAAAILVILASLALPGLAKAKSQSRVIQCLSNHRQLIRAWQLYAHDHNDDLVANDPSGPASWSAGVMDYNPSNSDNTNTLNVTDPGRALLAPYLSRVAAIYKCPEDQSAITIQGVSHPRVRSVSLSQAMNSKGDWLGAVSGLKYEVFRKMGDFNLMPPTRAICFLDEHPDSVNYGDFAIAMVSPDLLPRAKLIDVPGSLHNGAAAIGMADGHSESHRWSDSRTRPAVQYSPPPINVFSTPGNQDCLWLSARTSVPK